MCLLTKSKPPREGSLSSPYPAAPSSGPVAGDWARVCEGLYCLLLCQKRESPPRGVPFDWARGAPDPFFAFVDCLFDGGTHLLSLASLSLESRNAPIPVCFPRCCTTPIRVRLAVSASNCFTVVGTPRRGANLLPLRGSQKVIHCVNNMQQRFLAGTPVV